MTKPDVKRHLISVDSPYYGINTLTTMRDDVEWVNRQNGWYEDTDERTFGDEIALIHSEVSEMLEAYRHWGLEDATEREAEKLAVKPEILKPEGVGSEVADVLIRLLDFCRRYDIDLSAEYKRKMKFNRTRGYRHGGKRL